MEQNVIENGRRSINPQQMNKIRAIIENRIRINLDKEALKEDIEEFAM